MPPQKLGPCKQQACNIQSCISRNDYQERKCLKEIAALIACCDQEAAEGNDKPVHCAFNQRYRRLLAEAGGQEGQQGSRPDPVPWPCCSLLCIPLKAAPSSAVL
jgi:hypothetical protein